MSKVDSDLILNWLKEAVENKRPIPAEQWMDAALKLNILLADEHDKLVDAEQGVSEARLRIMDLQQKRNVAAADAEVEASPAYAALRRQKLKTDRVEEFIRLAKKYASINEFR